MKTRTILFIAVLALLIGIGIGYVSFRKKAQYPVINVQQDSATTSSLSPTSSGSTAKRTATAPTTPPVVYLNGGQHVTTTNLVIGQKLIVSLQPSTDGGYTIDPVQYNAAVLTLAKHTTTPANVPKGVVGASPTDTFEFIAIKSGATGITITQSRGGNPTTTLPLFSNAVSVK